MAMLSLVLTQLVPECWKELICVGFQVTLETLPMTWTWPTIVSISLDVTSDPGVGSDPNRANQRPFLSLTYR